MVQSKCKPRYLTVDEKLECEIFIGILPLLVADLRIPWSTVATATDASPEGWGVCETELLADDACSCGRWQERWRYRRLEPGEWKPRQRALKRCVFSDPLTVGGNLGELDDLDNYVVDSSFPEIPEHLLSPARWKTVGMGKWRHTDEHITMKEARCLLLAVRRLSRAQRHRHKRHLIFVDNMALCFSLGKGRSQNFGMFVCFNRLVPFHLYVV